MVSSAARFWAARAAMRARRRAYQRTIRNPRRYRGDMGYSTFLKRYARKILRRRYPYMRRRW